MQLVTRSWIRRALALSVATLGLSAVGVANAACNGATILKVSQNPGTCNGRVGFVPDVANRIVCSSTAIQDTIILSAHLANKTVKYQLGGGDNDCDPDVTESTAKAIVWIQTQP